MTFKFLRKNRMSTNSVEADEIFLDAKNIQNFDRQQFEGRIEKPISKKAILFLSFSFTFMVLVFAVRLMYLQVGSG